MEILSSIVGTVAEHTVVPIGRQASYLIFYKDNFSMLEVYVKDLEAAKERITHSVEKESRNGKKIEIGVMKWLEKVDEVIEKANQLQNDPRRANARCSAWSFPNLILRHRLSRKATKIVKDFIEVQEKGKSDQIGYHPTRKLLKEIIMKALTHPNSCNIGVYGLAGVGKTTLVNEVSQISKQQKLFDTVTTTNVTKYPDIKRIQGEIADLLGLQFDEETILGRAERLRQRIMMEKNILVILDDIWTKLDLKKVGIPFGNEHNGCKLLMTSRNLDVLLQMDVPKDFTFKLELMSENESWELFQIMAGDVVKDINLQSLASQVAKQCRGLPLVVATVARAMKHQRDVQSWKDALRTLQYDDHLTIFSVLELSYNSLESDEMRDVFLLFALFPCEKVHYFVKVAMGLDILKDIKTVDDARNKLYSIIHSLKATSLIEIKTSENIQMHELVRDFAISIARRDKHVYLRNQSDEEWPSKDFLTRCTQVVLDSCVSKLPQMIDCPNNKFFYLSSKKNRSLEVPDDFFEGMRSLRVLDLTFLNLSSLPTSFRFLTDLQTLCLNFCILKNMVEINALQNLVILSLLGSSMTKLPREIGQLTQLRMLDLSNSGIEVIPPNILSSLIKLEELYMGNTFVNWEDASSMVQNKNASIAELQKLPNMTTLELQIRETWMLPRDMQTVFEKLERFKIAIGDVWEWSDIVDVTSKTLMLKLETNIHLEHGIKALIKGVENLYLDDVGGIQNMVYQVIVEGFPLLKHLHVQNNANMKHIVDSQERNQIYVSFPFLETLVLHNLKNLEHICLNPLSVTCFGSLSVIKVKKCCQLKYLFSFTLVKELSHLSKIEVCQCNSMKEIVLGDNSSCASTVFRFRSLTLEHLETLQNFFSRSEQKHQGLEPSVSTPLFNDQVAFPDLDTLKLSSLNLNKIWNDNYHSMWNLTTLIVESCGRLKYLFSSTMVGSFKNLKHLEISNCPLMEELIAKEERNNEIEELQCLVDKDGSQVPTVLSKLVVLKLNGMENLEELFKGTLSSDSMENLEELSINDCEHLQSLFKCKLNLCNLKTIKLQSCPMLVSLYQLLTSQSLLSLETLKIGHCEKLENIIADERRDGESIKEIVDSENNKCLGSMLQKLKVLDIEGCPLLESIFPFLFVQDFPVLESIKIRRCHGLKFMFGQYQHVEFSSLRQLELSQLPNFIDMFCKSNHLISLSEKGSSSTSNHGSKAQLQLDLDPMKYNIFSWDTTTTTIPLLDGHYSESISYCVNIWERVQCLSIPSKILYNIKKMELSQFSKMESVFIPSIAPRMLLETLTIRNCDELKNIIDFGDYESGSNNWGDVFPKMKELYIEDCPKMDYIFGHDTNDHQNHVEIQLQLQLLELKCLSLCNLPSLVAMCPKHYRIRFPPLSKLELDYCSPAATKSMSQFIIDPVSESLDSTIIKGIEIIEEASTSKTRNEPPRQLVADLKQKGIKLSVEDITTSSLPTAKTITSSPGVEVIVEEGSTSTNTNTITSTTHLELVGSSSRHECKASSQDDDWDEEDWDETNIGFASQVEMLRQFKYDLPKERDLETTEDFADEVDVQATSGHRLQLGLPFQNDSDDDDDDDDEITVSKSRLSSIASQLPSYGTEVQATSGHGLTSSHENDIDSNILGFETKMKQTAEGNQDFVENVSGLEIPSIANSDVLMNGQSKSQQCFIDQLGEIDTIVKPSQENNLESSTSEKTSAATLSTTSETKNEPPIQLDVASKQKGMEIHVVEGTISTNAKTITSSGPLVTSECKTTSELEGSTSEKTVAVAGTLSTISGTKNAPPIQLDITPKQKGIEKSVEEGTASTYVKTITSSTHLVSAKEDGDGKISLPSFSTSTKPTATKYVDNGDSQETIAMEDIDNLIEDDPLLAFEKFLTGQVSISSIRVLLQELKTLMDSSSDLDHLVSNQESKSKLISLFDQLNQHQGMLTSDLKDFVDKVQNFFNENIIKHTTSQQVLNHHDKLLDSKSDLMNKLWSAKKTQAHIDSETSTANAQIQIDDLKSVMKICDVQKMKLKSECTEWAQQSKELISALASSKVAVREVERARNLAKEDFANLKSSFPTF